MKRLAKRVARVFGAHLYSDASLPTGVHWLHDIRRSGLVGRQPLCFDVGANVGQTVLELRRSLPGCVIHAFEPFSTPYAELWSACSTLSGVRPVQMALGSETGSMQVRPRAQSVLNSLLPSEIADEVEPCETIRIDTLDRYCAEHGIDCVDVLKTDTEGYDLQVLQGAQQMLQAQRVGVVYSEVTFHPGNRQNTPFQAVFEHLTAYGYGFLGLYETYPLHHFTEPNLFCNALFVSPTRRAAVAGQRLAV